VSKIARFASVHGTMPPVIRRGRIALFVAGASAAAALTVPTLAAGQTVSTSAPAPTVPATGATGATGPAVKAPKPKPQPQPDPRSPAHMSVTVHGIHKDGKLMVGKRARVAGFLRPFVPDQHVRVKLVRHGQVVRKLNPSVEKVNGADKGRFNFRSMPLIKPGTYKVIAEHERTADQKGAIVRSNKFRIRYPDLDAGQRNSEVKTFNQVLSKQGYYTSHGKKYSVRTQWAVMAVRKVNGMSRSYNANPKIFRMLAAGHAEFHLAYPSKGKHVEVDISKQVMALADHGKAQHTFAVSTGAAATPTIRGHYHFYRKDPGYNSEGMYYSVYFIRGYATHGYNPVPPYPASHGCVRNPIPDSIFIYNWIDLGDSIYVYG
jgi:lipoprotein-anchoring transpeptidase ErfK/SrfK